MVVAEARVDLLAAELLEQALAVLAVDLLEAVLVARLSQADLAGLLEAAVEVPADLVARAAVVAVRTPLRIPRTAKFPTPWRLARSPTT